MGAVIDTEKKELHAKNINRTISLQLTARGLFLLDINELAEPCHNGSLVETHVVSEAKQSEEAVSCLKKAAKTEAYEIESQEKAVESHNSQEKLSLHDLDNSHTPDTRSSIEARVNHTIDSNLRPKIPPKGFVVPNRLSNHGRLGSPFAEVADSGGTSNAGHEPVQHSSNGWISDRLRKSTPWRYLPGDLDQRPRLGEVVCGPLSRLEQHQTSHFLCTTWV